MQHQRQQAERFRLVRQQRGDQPAEPDRFLGEIAAAGLGAGGIGPAFGEGGVDGLEHGVEPLAQIGALGHAERNAGLADLVLGAHQPLAHRGRRDQEGRGDGGGVEAEDGLQDQRRADAGVDRRMGAGEHQRQAVVGNGRFARRRGLQLVGHQAQMSPAASTPVRRRRAASIILRRATASSHASGLLGNAARRPVGQRGREGVGQARPRPPRRRACAPRERRRACRSCGAPPPRRSRGQRVILSGHRAFRLHRPDRRAPRSRHGWRPGSAPPRRARRRGRARRSCSSRRAAPWSRHRGR